MNSRTIHATVTEIRKLTSSIETLNAKRSELLGLKTKLGELVTVEDSARGELEAIAATDAERLSNWVANGCTGRAPTADEKGRSTAASKLAAATARAIAVRTASSALDSDLAEVSSEIMAANEHLRGLRHSRLVELLDSYGAAFRLRMLDHAREEAFLLAAAQALAKADPAAARKIHGWRIDVDGSFLTRGKEDPTPETLLADGHAAFVRLIAAVASNPEAASIETALEAA